MTLVSILKRSNPAVAITEATVTNISSSNCCTASSTDSFATAASTVDDSSFSSSQVSSTSTTTGTAAAAPLSPGQTSASVVSTLSSSPPSYPAAVAAAADGDDENNNGNLRTTRSRTDSTGSSCNTSNGPALTPASLFLLPLQPTPPVSARKAGADKVRESAARENDDDEEEDAIIASSAAAAVTILPVSSSSPSAVRMDGSSSKKTKPGVTWRSQDVDVSSQSVSASVVHGSPPSTSLPRHYHPRRSISNSSVHDHRNRVFRCPTNGSFSSESHLNERTHTDWVRQVKETEAAMERVRQGLLRRTPDPQQQQSSPGATDRWFALAPYCLQLGNLHFRSGVSYNWAEHYYRTALLLCRGGCVTAPHDDDDDAVFYESRRRRRRSLLEADARFNLGAVYWTTGQIDESIAELRRALGCYEAMLMKDRSSPLEDVRTIKSITCYAASDDVVESRRANVWHQLGLAYCLQGKHETSLKCLERALRLRQENVTLTTTNPKLSDSQWVVDVASTHEIMAQVLALQKKRVGYR